LPVPDKNLENSKNISEKEGLNEIMKISETSLSEWQNEEDEIYDVFATHSRVKTRKNGHL